MGGIKTCFKNSKCNLHAQCDPTQGSKVAEDEEDCNEEYARKGLFPREATYRCQSPHYNDASVDASRSRGVVWIKAVPQDGNPECWKGEDELPTPWYLTYCIPGSVAYL